MLTVGGCANCTTMACEFKLWSTRQRRCSAHPSSGFSKCFCAHSSQRVLCNIWLQHPHDASVIPLCETNFKIWWEFFNQTQCCAEEQYLWVQFGIFLSDQIHHRGSFHSWHHWYICLGLILLDIQINVYNADGEHFQLETIVLDSRKHNYRVPWIPCLLFFSRGMHCLLIQWTKRRKKNGRKKHRQETWRTKLPKQ